MCLAGIVWQGIGSNYGVSLSLSIHFSAGFNYYFTNTCSLSELHAVLKEIVVAVCCDLDVPAHVVLARDTR